MLHEHYSSILPFVAVCILKLAFPYPYIIKSKIDNYTRNSILYLLKVHDFLNFGNQNLYQRIERTTKEQFRELAQP